MYYVYLYLHPVYGHLYCGRADNLDTRIYQHSYDDTDNIPREYVHLLRESIVMYIELKNKAQGVCVEAYYIDKLKPMLNKILKYEEDSEEDSDSELNLTHPKWKIYLKNVERVSLLHEENTTLKSENKKLLSSVNQLEFQLKEANNQLEYVKNKCKDNVPNDKVADICDRIKKEDEEKVIERPGRPQKITDEDIELIFKLRENGISIRQISKEVGYAVGTVQRYLNQYIS